MAGEAATMDGGLDSGRLTLTPGVLSCGGVVSGAVVAGMVSAGAASVTAGRIAAAGGTRRCRPFDRLTADGEDLGESRFHAPGHVVLRVDLEGLGGELVGTMVIPHRERTLRQADPGDGIAWVKRDDPLVHIPGLVDLVDLQEAVSLKDCSITSRSLAHARSRGLAVPVRSAGLRLRG